LTVFDFRYHALSLVAVLVALGLGLLLGVAIGDKQLVSSAKEDLVKGLRGDVRNANKRADELSGQLRLRDDFERQAYPALVRDALPGERIGLVFLGPSSGAVYDSVRAALLGTGGELGFVGVVREAPDLGALAARAAGTRYAALGDDASLLGPFAQRVGHGLVTGAGLATRERSALMSSFSGELTGVDAVIVYRSPSRPGDQDADAVRALEEGLVAGMKEANVPVVGAETTSTDPSQVQWYRDRGLPSADNVDHVPGRAALVFLLSGDADGTYGEKPSAEGLLPKVVGTPTTQTAPPAP
jgi:hypothetical protein